jgi:hypothetical protein
MLMHRSTRSGRGRSRAATVATVIATLTIAASAIVVAPASAATLTGDWTAAVGAGGRNGTSRVTVFADRSGSVSLALVRVRPSATHAVRIHRGTCATVGAVVASLAPIRATATGAASRTSALTASQAGAVAAATAGAGRIAIRIGSGAATRCGAFTAVPTGIVVGVSGPTEPMSTGGTRRFTATVTGSSDPGVVWSVVEKGGGSISADGVYTAPPLPGTYTVRASSTVDARATRTIRVPVVIPVGRIPGFDVGVDYHATGADFVHTAFLTRYHDPAVRRTVRTQLQGMADRGATLISTRIWLVTEPGTTDFGDAWRATFPLSAQEQKNLRAYAQDVAAIRGAAGNALRLDICLLWLGAADYQRGSPKEGLGWTPLQPAEFTRRVEATTDRVLAALSGVTRPDGTPVVDVIYLEGEIGIGHRANQEWFLTTHYPRFVERVSAAGFTPSVYFNASDTASAYLTPGYTDVDHDILDGHRSMFWVYRGLWFMKNAGLPLPSRVDFSWYVPTGEGATSAALLDRVLDDADATLPSLGLPRSYGIVETFYHPDATQRRELGQAIAAEAARDPRLQRVTFWTTPDSGGPGVHAGYPFAIEDFYPPPSASSAP